MGPFWHTLGNKLLTLFSNLCTNLWLTDEATGYKMFRRDLLARLALAEEGFGFCPEFTAKVSRLGLRLHEVAIRYRGRSRAEGKKIRLRDGWGAVRCLVKYSFGRRQYQPSGEPWQGQGQAPLTAEVRPANGVRKITGVLTEGETGHRDDRHSVLVANPKAQEALTPALSQREREDGSRRVS